jgi:tRNA threonylcarbamoyladenosine biosynthesis protein TsaB
MPFLGVDTATSRGSLALADGGRVLGERRLEQRAWHARGLVAAIDRLLSDAGIAPRDLQGIGVTVGPGSFTGVRVGMATGKGIAYGLGIALRGFSTLEALALAALPSGGGAAAICPALEAGRGELYAALFGAQGGILARRSPDRSWRPADLAGWLPAEAVIVGDGAATAVEAARAAGRRLAAMTPCPPLAGAIAVRVASLARQGVGYEFGSLAPNYVRPSDAEAARPRS